MNVKASFNNQPVAWVTRFNQRVPVFPDEMVGLEADVHLLAKARKKEKKLRKRCELKFTDPQKGPKAQYNYLSSLACLQANMLDANGRRDCRHRSSLQGIIKTSTAFSILINLNEPVSVFQVPKSCGTDFRTIHDFGLAARGAQRMASKLLRMTFSPAQFQYTSKGVHKAISEARRLIIEEGYTHTGELDIVSHYNSFAAEALMHALPLPKSANKQIIMAASAQWHNKQTFPVSNKHIFHATPSGLPQGSAASSVVAEWSISHLKMLNIKDVALINYADNFFLFAKSEMALALALEALRSAIAKLPGGVFKAHPEKDSPGLIRTVDQGFYMLGCEILLGDEGLEINPTKKSCEKLNGFFQLESHKVEAILTTAKMEQNAALRFEGVQAFLRLSSFIKSWMSAHSFCTDIKLMDEDMTWQLDMLAYAYGLTSHELSVAQDASTEVRYRPSSGCAAY